MSISCKIEPNILKSLIINRKVVILGGGVDGFGVGFVGSHCTSVNVWAK